MVAGIRKDEECYDFFFLPNRTGRRPGCSNGDGRMPCFQVRLE